MSSPFLLGFSRAVVDRAVADGLIALAPNADRESVAHYIADYLGARTFGSSIVSSLAAALLACPGVDEVFADDDRLKDVVDAVPRSSLPR